MLSGLAPPSPCTQQSSTLPARPPAGHCAAAVPPGPGPAVRGAAHGPRACAGAGRRVAARHPALGGLLAAGGLSRMCLAWLGAGAVGDGQSSRARSVPVRWRASLSRPCWLRAPTRTSPPKQIEADGELRKELGWVRGSALLCRSRMQSMRCGSPQWRPSVRCLPGHAAGLAAASAWLPRLPVGSTLEHTSFCPASQVREMFAFSFACATERWDLELTVRARLPV